MTNTGAALTRAAAAALAAAALLVGLTACGVFSDLAERAGIAAPPAASAAPAEVRGETATLVKVVDGDTITTDRGKVRIIGIDTPERDECGYAEASALLADLMAPGDELTLELPPGQNAEDRYGRLLRHVFTAEGVDIALRQLEEGLAVARYDSADGYPEHPYEREYHAAERAAAERSLGPCGQTEE